MNRKIQHLRIYKQNLMELFQSGPHWVDVKEGLPVDAIFGGIYYDEKIQCFLVEVYSNLFDEVPEGQTIPWINDIKFTNDRTV